ncbi:hypothetical protein CPHO_08320 [Corynebacterium phocae]|uniref:Uncharacterized protein n=1 Tax=Corynebacterium phocae TaxID=161895 RepID=A0A1L7D422_9CORY|nr:hypothetical protein [Corynebacterium phocae]APT92889.1 hypothetical protein CPHO_08320 [Corynebacterium phocae]KAA8723211.1 hypothetical protein F4V58_07815 [Corynebacterium phocae]
MATIAKAPNSCELDKLQNRGWQVQAKPRGAGPEEYKFVQGRTSTTVKVDVNRVDGTDLDSDGWTYEEAVSRALTVSMNLNYVQKGDLPLVTESQRLLKLAGESLGGDNKVDVRVWRTDIDEGWESTFGVMWEDQDGDANGFRSASVTLSSVCAPKRIKSVEEGNEKAASVEVDKAELRKVLDPAGESDAS